MFSATNLAIIGIVAVATAISVLSCGAAAPIMAVAVVTLVAGVGTLAFAAAEAQEAITDDQNYLRDSVFQGNQEAYNITMATVSTTAMIGTMIIAPYAGKCFIAGTGVLTANGAMAIEDIEVGMLVYAYDDATGEVELKPVVQLFRNETYQLTKVSTSDGQVIVSTPGHPYYTVNRGWIHASELRAGDILLLVNGKTVVVEWIQHELLESPVKVYNFEVADYHTYYVAESVGIAEESFVLVHNIGCGVGGKGWEGDATWRANVKTVSKGGDIRGLKGGIPTQEQGIKLINEAGGKVIRIDTAHVAPNPHTYNHINYIVKGVRSALEIILGL